MTDDPQKQNDINNLPTLDQFRYENIFNVYQNKTGQYFYNILRKVNFPEDINETVYSTYVVPNDNLPYTFISYKVYGTIYLWWVICSVNHIINPVNYPTAGTKLKILKPEYVRSVLQSLQQ
jgi:hypothetical protein